MRPAAALTGCVVEEGYRHEENDSICRDLLCGACLSGACGKRARTIRPTTDRDIRVPRARWPRVPVLGANRWWTHGFRIAFGRKTASRRHYSGERQILCL